MERAAQAVRGLGTAPGLALAVVLVSGIGLAAVIVVASLVDGFLLRGLPYAGSERLVWLESVQGDQILGVSHPDFLDFQERIEPLQGLAHLDARNHMVLSLGDRSESVLATRTTSDLFPLLGVEPVIGRAFTEEADQPGAGRVLLLSHDLWSRYFAADTGVLGREVQLDGAAFTVIGVMPSGFHFPVASDIWVPSSSWADQWPHRAIRVSTVVGRLAPGATLATARQAAAAAARGLAEEHPDTNTGLSVRLTPLREVWTAGSRPFLVFLLVTCGLLLLIAAANSTNLLLVWSARRSREMAIRKALGATVGRIVTSRVLESTLLGLLAGAVALPLALLGLRWAETLVPADLPNWIELGLNPTLTALALGLSVAYGAALGLAVALRSSRGLTLEELTPSARGTVGAPAARMRRALAMAQVALALVLVVSAGLLAKSLHGLQGTDPGFDTGDVLTLELDLPAFGIESYQQVSDLYRQVVEETGNLTGVGTAAMTTSLPLGGQESWHLWEITLEDQSAEAQRQNPRVHGQGVSEDYFTTMDIPVVEGRAFEPRDVGAETPGLIVSRRLAQRLWPDRPALGRRLKLGGHAIPSPWMQVVGVVGDVRYDSLENSDQLDLYAPLGRLPSWPIHLLAEVDGQPAEFAVRIRERVWSVSPDIGLRAVQPLEEHIDHSLWRQRTWTTLLGLFASLALLLAVTGVFAVMSQVVEARRREMAVRVALGAGRGEVTWRILREAGWLAGVGIVAGAAGAFLGGGLLQRLLVDVAPADPAVFAAGTTLLLAATLFACLPPLRRALTTDPQAQLRQTPTDL